MNRWILFSSVGENIPDFRNNINSSQSSKGKQRNMTSNLDIFIANEYKIKHWRTIIYALHEHNEFCYDVILQFNLPRKVKQR